MYSRSPRKSCEPSYATQPIVGPGCYFHQSNSLKHLLKTDASAKNDAKAPFSSTSPRISYFDELATHSGPSPDTYEQKISPACVPFAATNSPRFKVINQASPGPAVYNISRAVNHAIDQARRCTGNGKDQTHQISWIRQQVPPSIPYGPQTAGYDEDPSGELTLRKPPKNKLEFLPVHGDFINTEKAHAFAKSKTERHVWTQNITDPGPGSYVIPSTLKKFEPSTVLPKAPFGALSGRFVESERALKCKTEMDPSPASYDIKLLPKMYIDKGKENPCQPILARTKVSDLGFGTKELRFKPAFLAVASSHFHSDQRASYIPPGQGPGPGTYTIASSLLDPIVLPKPNVSFGAANDRFMDPNIELKQKQLAAFPGPASYDLPELSKINQNTDPQSVSKPVHQYTKSTEQCVGFGTQAQRFSSNQTCTPPPGQYDLNQGKTKKNKKKPSTAPANSQTNNLGEDDRAGFIKPVEGPGPGEYDPKLNPLLQRNEGHAAVSAFVSQLPRLIELKHLNPAPNTYTQLDTMIKPTFNSSLEGNHYSTGLLVKPRTGLAYRYKKQDTTAEKVTLINIVSV